MKMGFEEEQTPYSSGSQLARVWTERWVADWLYCANCGNPRITQLPPNMPVADFACGNCTDQFELKSQKKAFGKKVADGAYSAKCERLSSSTNPNLLLLRYNKAEAAVIDVCIIPKHFFTLDIIEKRKPLASTARRAGWVGSNIVIERVPEVGRVYLLRGGVAEVKSSVLEKWQATLFLRKQGLDARGWLIEVMQCVERIGARNFGLEDIYAFEQHFQRLYPRNNNVRAKIRQQLQVLRDNDYLDFVGGGRYEIRLPLKEH